MCALANGIVTRQGEKTRGMAQERRSPSKPLTYLSRSRKVIATSVWRFLFFEFMNEQRVDAIEVEQFEPVSVTLSSIEQL
jgi:hypothetical protein